MHFYKYLIAAALLISSSQSHALFMPNGSPIDTVTITTISSDGC